MIYEYCKFYDIFFILIDKKMIITKKNKKMTFLKFVQFFFGRNVTILTLQIKLYETHTIQLYKKHVTLLRLASLRRWHSQSNNKGKKNHKSNWLRNIIHAWSWFYSLKWLRLLLLLWSLNQGKKHFCLWCDSHVCV